MAHVGMIANIIVLSYLASAEAETPTHRYKQGTPAVI